MTHECSCVRPSAHAQTCYAKHTFKGHRHGAARRSHLPKCRFSLPAAAGAPTPAKQLPSYVVLFLKDSLPKVHRFSRIASTRISLATLFRFSDLDNGFFYLPLKICASKLKRKQAQTSLRIAKFKILPVGREILKLS